MLVILIFIVGYLAIILEDKIGVNKTASALITGVLCWVVIILQQPAGIHIADGSLNLDAALKHNLANLSEILFFLLGAMTIVELIDAHNGFELITNRITTKNETKLLRIIAVITFILSSFLDNLTGAIVMVSVARKLVKPGIARQLIAGIVIIAANAGGAFSPIGDVTTTMLWLNGNITSGGIISSLFLPSVVCLAVPLLFIRKKLGPTTQVTDTEIMPSEIETPESIRGQKVMLIAGTLALFAVPMLKAFLDIPAYLGMLLMLGIVWLISEIVHFGRDEEECKPYSAAAALTRIDAPCILFFLGILLAVGALEHNGSLLTAANALVSEIKNLDVIVVLIGFFSAVVDNVPLVAASIAMFPKEVYPIDNKLWVFLAYAAGTGGSILIIGSAAGVAVMGLEKISFKWYFKNISWVATLGYLAGAATYLLQYQIISLLK